MDLLQNASFLEQGKARFHSLDTSSSLYKVRSSWWERFLGLQSEGSTTGCKWGEEVDFAAKGSISLEEIKPFIFPECRNSVLVLVNGYFEPTLSDISGVNPKVVVQSMEQASKVYGALLGQEASRYIEEETHPIGALHEALAQEGLFLYVPPKIEVDPPLQILLCSMSAKQIALPKLVLSCGAHTRLQLVLSHHCLEGNGEKEVLSTDLRLEEESSVKVLESGLEGLHFMRTKVKRGARFESFLGSCGSSSAFYRHHLSLIGEGAEASLQGLFLPSSKKEITCQVQVNHHAPHCRSHQKFKGVLQDVSRARFAGKIFVRSAAQKTEAFQKNQFLLLGERASAESCPGLEIFADDVKASHGATIGQLDQEQLFYLKARGIHESVAKGLVVEGFCQDFFASIFLPSLAAFWRKQASLCK